MFDERAFRSWIHILLGATVFGAAFVGLMVVAEPVVSGDSDRFARATYVIGAAAFLGYVGTASILRHAARDGQE